MQEVKHFYRKLKSDFEYCFNVGTSSPLSTEELATLQWLLAETFEIGNFGEESFLKPARDIIEVGPRLNFDTAYSTNAVAICHACGLEKVIRVECSRRYLVSSNTDKERFIAENHDRMTECPYPEPIESFKSVAIAEKVFSIPLMSGGIDVLRGFNRDSGLGMDEWDV